MVNRESEADFWMASVGDKERTRDGTNVVMLASLAACLQYHKWLLWARRMSARYAGLVCVW
jgi:hypothetical protein